MHSKGKLKVTKSVQYKTRKYIIDDDNFVVAQINSEANAERLVMCWNMHDELVEDKNNLIKELGVYQEYCPDPKSTKEATDIILKANSSLRGQVDELLKKAKEVK